MKKEEIIKELNSFKKEVKEAFEAVAKDIASMKAVVNVVSDKPVSFSITNPSPPKQENTPFGKVTTPIEVRELIDVTLNKHFGVEIEPHSYTQFLLKIVVPPKYSTAKKDLVNDLGGDLRVKVIDHAMGLNGVREYVEKVWNTFKPEYQALIVADRLALEIQEPAKVA